GLYRRRVLGRHDDRSRAATLYTSSADAAAKHRNFRGVPADRVPAATGSLWPKRAEGMNMERLRVSPLRWVALIAVIYLMAILLVKNQYYQLMMTLVPVWATMGLSWNILSGYSGLVSFGHASFFGLGAYTVALSLIKFGLTPWIGIPIAAGVGALAGLVIGYPTFRLRGHYFALAMLAYP